METYLSWCSVMSGGRASPESPHVYRGGFRLPKHLKSPLHLPEGEDGSAFGIGHASPLLHKCPTMTGLGSSASSYSSNNNNNGERASGARTPVPRGAFPWFVRFGPSECVQCVSCGVCLPRVNLGVPLHSSLLWRPLWGSLSCRGSGKTVARHVTKK